MLFVSEVGVADGRANRRDKPTVGDRPRAPSPPALPAVHDNQYDQQQDEDEDGDDDWDEIRFV